MLVTTHTEKLTFKVEDLSKLYEAGILSSDVKIELLNGEIYIMSPINYSHAYCVNVLNKFFTKQLSDRFVVAIQNPILLNEQTLPEPDVVIYEDDIISLQQHPTADMAKLLIEVADTSYFKDREQKFPLYAQAGITQVWIINLNKKVVEVYEQPVGNEYASLHIYYEHHTVPTPFGLALQVQSLFLSTGKTQS